MKRVPSALTTHLAGSVTTLSSCWILTLRNGTVLRFTDHDKDITIAAGGSPSAQEAGTYLSAVGYTSSNIQSASDGSVDNLEVNSILDDSTITEEDLQGGIYDGAEVRIFLVNWASPSSGIIALKRGYLGEVSIEEGLAKVELRGLQQVLQQQIGRTYGPACNADFGDARCGINLLDHTVTGTVASITDRANFIGSMHSSFPVGFDQGLLTFTSGANSGRSAEVKSYVAGAVTAYVAFPEAIAPGDNYTLSRGCDKQLSTCLAYNNVPNFRGFPHIPGIDRMLRYPDAV